MKWAEGRTTEHRREKYGVALSWWQPGGINRFCIGITTSLNCDVTVIIAVSHSHTLAFRCRWRASSNDMKPYVSLLAHAAGWWVVLTHRTKGGLESRCYANKERETNVHTHIHTHTLVQREKCCSEIVFSSLLWWISTSMLMWYLNHMHEICLCVCDGVWRLCQIGLKKMNRNIEKPGSVEASI